MNTVWHVPFKAWPGFVGRRVRGFTILMALGIGILMSSTLIGFAPQFGPLAGTWTWVASALVNFGVFLAAFTLLTAATIRVRDVLVGVVIATVFWEVLQAVGELYVRYVINHAADVYGFFAIVIGLLTWVYTGARLTLLAAEINVVLRYRLWPRSMTQPPFTPQDKAAFVLLAKMEERRPEETVEATFSAEADRQPLDELATPVPHFGPGMAHQGHGSDAADPLPPPPPPPAGGSADSPPSESRLPQAFPSARREARDRLRLAAQRLAADAEALATAHTAARQVGLETRMEDLRRAVVDAELAGMSREEVTADSGLDAAIIDLLIAAHRMGHGHSGTHDSSLPEQS